MEAPHTAAPRGTGQPAAGTGSPVRTAARPGPATLTTRETRAGWWSPTPRERRRSMSGDCPRPGGREGGPRGRSRRAVGRGADARLRTGLLRRAARHERQARWPGRTRARGGGRRGPGRGAVAPRHPTAARAAHREPPFRKGQRVTAQTGPRGRDRGAERAGRPGRSRARAPGPGRCRTRSGERSSPHHFAAGGRTGRPDRALRPRMGRAPSHHRPAPRPRPPGRRGAARDRAEGMGQAGNAAARNSARRPWGGLGSRRRGTAHGARSPPGHRPVLTA